LLQSLVLGVVVVRSAAAVVFNVSSFVSSYTGT